MKDPRDQPYGHEDDDDLPWVEGGRRAKSAESLDYIGALTVQNIRDMPFPQFLEALRPYVLERVPEGIQGNADVMALVDTQIGRFANLYGYLAYLFAYVGSEARRAKMMDKGAYESLLAKKDALYRLIQAVELKWRACSRQVTVEVEGETEFDKPNYRNREERVEQRRSGWDAVQ